MGSKARRSNHVLAGVLASVSFGMVGLSFAAVPLYDLFCRVTGYGGTPQRVEAADGRVLDREVIVRFDANRRGLPWAFYPEVPQVRVKLGETIVVNYIAENVSDRPTAGTATFNVTPNVAGSYFNKIACFCFTEQALEPGERVEMPVQFFVSPDMVDNREMAGVRAITLSYTFYPLEEPGQPVAQTAGDDIGERL